MNAGELSDSLAAAMRRIRVKRGNESRAAYLAECRAAAQRGEYVEPTAPLLYRWQVEAEIDWHQEARLMPSQRLMEVAARRGWLPVHLTNLIVNLGPGAPADTDGLRKPHAEVIELLRGGFDRDSHFFPV